MRTAPQISMDLLRTYFKETSLFHNGRAISITLSPSTRGFAFSISLESVKPLDEGAMPKERIALERHAPTYGHSEIHIQIDLYKEDNPLDIGTIRYYLDIEDGEDLEETAGGFIFLLRDAVRCLLNDEEEVNKLFHNELVDDLEPKAVKYKEKISKAKEQRNFEFQNIDRERVHITDWTFNELLEKRTELIPLLGQ